PHRHLSAFPTRRSSDLLNDSRPKSRLHHSQRIRRPFHRVQKVKFKEGSRHEKIARPLALPPRRGHVWDLPPWILSARPRWGPSRSEEHTSELQSRVDLV